MRNGKAIARYRDEVIITAICPTTWVIYGRHQLLDLFLTKVQWWKTYREESIDSSIWKLCVDKIKVLREVVCGNTGISLREKAQRRPEQRS